MWADGQQYVGIIMHMSVCTGEQWLEAQWSTHDAWCICKNCKLLSSPHVTADPSGQNTPPAWMSQPPLCAMKGADLQISQCKRCSRKEEPGFQGLKWLSRMIYMFELSRMKCWQLKEGGYSTQIFGVPFKKINIGLSCLLWVCLIYRSTVHLLQSAKKGKKKENESFSWAFRCRGSWRLQRGSADQIQTMILFISYFLPIRCPMWHIQVAVVFEEKGTSQHFFSVLLVMYAKRLAQFYNKTIFQVLK